MTQPNILFIFSDQQRWDTVSCYGSPIVENLTPNLDAMAAQGTRFHNAFTCQPVCGPARSCMQSGLYATQTGCETNNRSLPLDQRTIARVLNDTSYETAYLGKWHLASDKDHNFAKSAIPEERRGGYKDYWLASDILEFTSHGYEGYFHDINNRRVDWEGYRVDAQTNFLLQYLRDYKARDSGKPFFMFASYIEPHHQNDLDRYVGPIGSKQRFAQYNTPGDLLGTRPEPGARCDWPQHMPDYLGCCWSLDHNLGRIRAELDVLGLADNTVVIYTSDHGCHFCTRNSEYKRSCHDNAIRVPMIATGPGFTGGGVRNELVSLIDMPTTFLAAAGADIPDAYQGRPVQGLVDGSANDWPEEVFVQISESQTGRAIRTHRWKYCVDAPDLRGQAGRSDRYVEQYLYDLEADPHERNNLVTDASLAEVRAELAATLKRRMVEAGEAEPTIAAA